MQRQKKNRNRRRRLKRLQQNAPYKIGFEIVEKNRDAPQLLLVWDFPHIPLALSSPRNDNQLT